MKRKMASARASRARTPAGERIMGHMRMRTRTLLVPLLLMLSGCAGPPGGPPEGTIEARSESLSFVGKIWISTDAAAAPGTLRTFLADGTLIMDSCVETYRLARWAPSGEGRIAWEEDGARIEAEVTRATPEELLLRLHLANHIREEHYRPAHVPYVCPDSRSSALTPDGRRAPYPPARRLVLLSGRAIPQRLAAEAAIWSGRPAEWSCSAGDCS
jgi:hypothetical protein